MPIFSFKCEACEREWDEICNHNQTIMECECGGIADKRITSFARYKGDMGSASTTPRGAANRSKTKLNFRIKKDE